MRTRNSTKSTNNPTKLPHYDVTENFVLSSDESEVEKFQAKYAPQYARDSEEERPDNSKVESKTRRRNRGKLEKLHNLPLDIVLEIYSYLEPLDILRLSRTSKDMRTFLMTRNNAIIWRKARLNVPDLPPLLEDISSEPQYASLVFESYCHICLRKPCENVFWQCRVRCCNRCFSTVFSSRPNLHSVWHRSYAGTFLLFDKIAPYIPHVSVIPWQGPWDGEDKVYFPPNVRALRHEYRSVRKGEIGLEDWILRKKKLFGQLMEHAAACSRWQKESHDLRAKDLQLTRSRRKGAIFEKLRDLGWGEEIHRLETDGNGVLSSHKDVRQSKDLTDKAWFRIQPRLVRVLEDARSQRLEEEHSA